MDKEIPVPTAFNHEIAAIKLGNNFLFMDTTSDNTPFGYLPFQDQGRNVLVVDVEKEKGTVAETPIDPPERNVEGFRGIFSLSPLGEIKGDFSFYYKGVYSSFERGRLLSLTQEDLKRYVNSLASRVSPGFDVEEFKVSNYKDLSVEDIEIEIKGKDLTYGTLTSHFLIAKFPTPAYERIVSLVASKSRKYPYVVGYKMEKVSEVELEIPEGFTISVKPEDFFFNNRVGSFEVKWKLEGDKLKFTSKMVLKKNVIPKEEYQDLRELFNTTVKTLRNQIVILKREEK
jgi:hypothetical protein